MTSRERVLRTIRFQQPDRLPILHAVLPGGWERHGDQLKELFARYPSDFGGLADRCGSDGGVRAYTRGEFRDAWGCRWENILPGLEGQPRGHPLEDWKALESFPWPDPNGGEWTTPQPRPDPSRFVILGGGASRLWERMHFMRGMEALFEDIAGGRPEVEVLRDRILDFSLKRIERQLAYDCDGISFMDDWGCQDRLMIRPSDWRRLFRPAYRRIVDLVHAHKKLFYFHSDGYILDILPDLIEIGVDVVNPQFSCHDLTALARLCAGRICVSTDLDRQRLLPRGAPEEVRREVARILESFSGHGGGLILRGEIGPDVPLANAESMLRAFFELGDRV
ncbi:MAG: hypothetical protein HYU36_00225 [Planctomycetes bacterium]|nr:hypothetical protein [Planctomycetota bacterium]